MGIIALAFVVLGIVEVGIAVVGIAVVDSPEEVVQLEDKLMVAYLV